MMLCCQGRGLLAALHITESTMVNYLTLLEQHYRPTVAYHNSIHAADVTQTSHVMLLAPALEVSNPTSMEKAKIGCLSFFIRTGYYAYVNGDTMHL